MLLRRPIALPCVRLASIAMAMLLSGCAILAIDGSGNAWVLDYAGGLHETLGIATPVVTPVTPSALGVRP